MTEETIPMKAIVVTDQAAGRAGMTLVERPEPPAAINDVVVGLDRLPAAAALSLSPRRGAVGARVSPVWSLSSSPFGGVARGAWPRAPPFLPVLPSGCPDTGSGRGDSNPRPFIRKKWDASFVATIDQSRSL
jgi:hypothetical protein